MRHDLEHKKQGIVLRYCLIVKTNKYQHVRYARISASQFVDTRSQS